ncbi:protein phosphatase 2C-like domain-containing protein 1 [Lacerta agilis]|uniref:protein phosphatase 2C-like domain-containing protein 1 n=1 Tax=Lacerta agilis TaxID=80427 RepID=UPI00141A0C98|nr:protein phosphatase 2C-like domain-containing protein 1 [Lacerta agilis]
MSWEKASQQSKSNKSEEEDPTKVVKNDFKKVDKLDITVLCSICQQMVHISEILFHKKVHQALAVLDYQRPWVESIDIDEIVYQRKRLLFKMKKYKIPKYVERKKEKIGYAFDLLKESMKPTPYFCIDSIAQSSVHIEEVTNPLIKAIAICQDKNARWHENLEDVFVVLDNYGNRAGTCFLGVFDGSNGISAAETTSVELPVLLLDQLSQEDPSYQVSEAGKEFIDSFCTVFRADYKVRERLFTQKGARGKKSWPGDYEWVHRAYAKSFWRMDRLLRLGRNEVSRVCWSSCTAATCIIENISSEKESQQDEEEKKTLEKVTDEEEQNIRQQNEEETPKRIFIAKKKCDAEQGVALLVTNKERGSVTEHQPEEPLEGTNDRKESSTVEPENDEQVANNKDVIQEEDLLESKQQKQGESLERRDDRAREPGDNVQIADHIDENQEEGLLENIGQQQVESSERTDDHTGEPGDNVHVDDHIDGDQEEGLLQNMEQQQGESSERTNDHAQESGDNVQIADHIDESQEEGLLENMEQQQVESSERTGDHTGEPGDNVHVADHIDGDQEEGLLQNMEQQQGESSERTNDHAQESGDNVHVADHIDESQEEGLLENMEQQQGESSERTNDLTGGPGDNEHMADSIDGSQEEEELEDDNSSALTEEKFGLMHIANIGNVHAVLCKNGKSYWVTKEHSTYSREERIRVLKNGGSISSNEPKGLIEGLIKSTRGLGYHGNPKLKNTVIPVPHTISFPVDDSCQFLILASNGLWEVLDKSEAVLLTLTMFSAYLEKYQRSQLKKTRMSKGTELPLNDLEAEFYSWYLNKDFFADTDLQNLRSSSGGEQEQEMVQSGSSAEEESEEAEESEADEEEAAAEEEEESETTLEVPGSWDLSDDTSHESTELTSPEFEINVEEPEPESFESSEISEDSEINSRTFYALAAKYISKHLVEAALKAGSRDNITVLIALLNGCDKIPTYI